MSIRNPVHLQDLTPDEKGKKTRMQKINSFFINNNNKNTQTFFFFKTKGLEQVHDSQKTANLKMHELLLHTSC